MDSFEAIVSFEDGDVYLGSLVPPLMNPKAEEGPVSGTHMILADASASLIHEVPATGAAKIAVEGAAGLAFTDKPANIYLVFKLRAWD